MPSVWLRGSEQFYLSSFSYILLVKTVIFSEKFHSWHLMQFLCLVLVEPKAPCYRAHVCVRNSGFSRILSPTTRDHFRAMFVWFSYSEKTWRRRQLFATIAPCAHIARLFNDVGKINLSYFPSRARLNFRWIFKEFDLKSNMKGFFENFLALSVKNWRKCWWFFPRSVAVDERFSPAESCRYMLCLAISNFYRRWNFHNNFQANCSLFLAFSKSGRRNNAKSAFNTLLTITPHNTQKRRRRKERTTYGPLRRYSRLVTHPVLNPDRQDLTWVPLPNQVSRGFLRDTYF